uniref:Uncharacterized protein n=1 Tax=Opuntia streptacantha TaxID=393608 RepID=A0A7C9AJY7_OPUST
MLTTSVEAEYSLTSSSIFSSSLFTAFLFRARGAVLSSLPIFNSILLLRLNRRNFLVLFLTTLPLPVLASSCFSSTSAFFFLPPRLLVTKLLKFSNSRSSIAGLRL